MPEPLSGRGSGSNTGSEAFGKLSPHIHTEVLHAYVRSTLVRIQPGFCFDSDEPPRHGVAVMPSAYFCPIEKKTCFIVKLEVKL